jgi:hypothetical protein
LGELGHAELCGRTLTNGDATGAAGLPGATFAGFAAGAATRPKLKMFISSAAESNRGFVYMMSVLLADKRNLIDGNPNQFSLKDEIAPWHNRSRSRS